MQQNPSIVVFALLPTKANTTNKKENYKNAFL